MLYKILYVFRGVKYSDGCPRRRFFGAFLPQFLDPNAALLQQFAIMALTFAVGEFCVEYGLVRLAFTIRPWLARVGKRFNQGCGGLFAAIGVALPFTGP